MANMLAPAFRRPDFKETADCKDHGHFTALRSQTQLSGVFGKGQAKPVLLNSNRDLPRRRKVSRNGKPSRRAMRSRKGLT